MRYGAVTTPTPNERDTPQVTEHTPSIRASHVNQGTAFTSQAGSTGRKRGAVLRRKRSTNPCFLLAESRDPDASQIMREDQDVEEEISRGPAEPVNADETPEFGIY